MAVQNRITQEIIFHSNNPDYDVADFIHYVDQATLYSAIAIYDTVPVKYVKVVGDDLIEMTQPEKDAVDVILAAEEEAAIKTQLLEESLNASSTAEALIATSSATLLAITSNVSGTLAKLIDNDVTNIPSETFAQEIRVVMTQNIDTANFRIVALARPVDGTYPELDNDEFHVLTIDEYTLIANGTDLVKL